MKLDLDSYRTIARAQLGDSRYAHTLAVARLAGELAEKYGADAEAAKAAGLLHDVTKEVPHDAQLQIVQKSDIIVDAYLLANPNVYHSLTGYLYARDTIQIQDPDILNAIRYPTTGRADMSLLEKIVYTADAVGYDRTYPDAAKLRELAFRDIDACMLEILEFTIVKLLKTRAVIAMDTFYCYDWLCLDSPHKRGSHDRSPGEVQ